MKDFLISSAYGTAAGALVGVASLAFTDDPGSKLNNIARGASLGLYAGMGLGLYMAYGNTNSVDSRVENSAESHLWLQAQWKRNQIEGLSLQTVFARF